MGWLTVSDTPERRANLASMRSDQLRFNETLDDINSFGTNLQAHNRAGSSSQSNLSQIAGNLGVTLMEETASNFQWWNDKLENLRQKVGNEKEEHYNTFLKQYEVPVIRRKGFQSGKTLVERSFDMSVKSQQGIEDDISDLQDKVTEEKDCSIPSSPNRSSNAGPSNTYRRVRHCVAFILRPKLPVLAVPNK